MKSLEFKMDKDAPLLPTTEEYKSVLQLVERAYMEQITLFQEDLYNKGYGDGYRAAKDEIVRCKDCKNYNQNPYSEEDEKWCMCWSDWIPTEPDDFCSYGERKDDAD